MAKNTVRENEIKHFQNEVEQYKKSLEDILKNMLKDRCYDIIKTSLTDTTELRDSLLIIRDLDLSNKVIGEIQREVINALEGYEHLQKVFQNVKFDSDTEVVLILSKIEVLDDMLDFRSDEMGVSARPMPSVDILKRRRDEGDFSSTFWKLVDKFLELVGLNKSTMGVRGAKISDHFATLFPSNDEPSLSNVPTPPKIMEI